MRTRPPKETENRPVLRHGSSATLWVAVALAALAIGAPRVPLVENLELRAHDVRFQLRGQRAKHVPVIVIAVDDDTVKAWSDRPKAFWGDRYAKLFDNARQNGVIEMGTDVISATHGEEYLQTITSRALSQAGGKIKGGVLSYHDIDAILAAPDEPEMTPDTAYSRAIVDSGGHVALTNNLASSLESGLLAPELTDLKEITRRPYIGFADLSRQSDDAVRTKELFVQRAGEDQAGAVEPSISGLVSARATADRLGSDAACRADSAADLLRLTKGRAIVKQVEDGSMATFWLNPPGAPGELPYIVSATRLVDHPEALTLHDHEALRGAVAMVGITAHHFDNDVYRAPGGDRTDVPGVVFQAFAISTLLDGAALGRFAWWQEGLLAASLILLWAFTARVLRLSFLPGLLLAVAIAVLWGIACLQFFVRADMLLPVAAPMLFVLAAVFLTYGIASVEESAERRNIENIFGRNVSPPVRDYLMQKDKTELKRGATSGASVLFFDVRGSTAFAEGRSPEEVIVALNELFASIVPMVEAHGGLINRFLGDGFLALFGVPVPLPDHALAAAETAFEIVDHLETAERKARQASGGEGRGKPAPILSGGCGVHSGPFVYGYLGAPNRAEFTVIGDTINLAARLESLNKSLGSLAVFSDTTVEHLPPILTGRLSGPLEREVSGRHAKAKVYTLGSRTS